MNKIVFLDRDGALISEPPDTFQVDSIEQLQVLPGVVDGLQRLLRQGFKLVMVTNQDDLGTDKNPQANFDTVQEELFGRLDAQGISFYRVFVCPHFKEDKCLCRKPMTGMVDNFLKDEQPDLLASIMIGDRETDKEFAKNIGIKFFKVETNGHFPDINL
jgi:imidazoleglycerol-phosphate dehydratase/histidinol-phosphatase